RRRQPWRERHFAARDLADGPNDLLERRVARHESVDPILGTRKDVAVVIGHRKKDDARTGRGTADGRDAVRSGRADLDERDVARRTCRTRERLVAVGGRADHFQTLRPSENEREAFTMKADAPDYEDAHLATVTHALRPQLPEPPSPDGLAAGGETSLFGHES